MRKIKMDITTFAVPSPRCGSIETHSGYGAPPMNGAEIHAIVQKILAQKNSTFVKERPYSLTIELDKFDLQISGRADGVIEDPLDIIEIKTAFDIDKLKKKIIEQPNHPYVWQLKTYGHIHFKAHGEVPKLTLKLVSQRNIKKFYDLKIEFDLSEYVQWLDRRLAEIEKDVLVQEKLLTKRQKMAESLPFPFTSPRPGQNELIDIVSTYFEGATPLLIQAPTGLGKTAGLLYPSLKESFSRGQKTVYVTPKNSQHKVAEEAVDLINNEGAKIRRLTLTSKAKMCFKTEPFCDPDQCEYARDYFLKFDQHDLKNKIRKTKKLSARKFKKWGEDHEVCPFELSLEAIHEADVVIADYNYVFSPYSLISRLSSPLLESELANLVIDEAHNLPARAIDYFSPKISSLTLMDIDSALHRVNALFKNEAQGLIQEIKEIIASYGAPEFNSKKININADLFLDLDERAKNLTLRYLESDVEIKEEDPILKLSNLISDFTAGLELSGLEFFHSYQKYRANETLKITCSDARKHLSLAYKEFKNTAAFSATLRPFQYYQELLGLPESTRAFEFKSPFLKENRKIILIPQVSTKYSDRSQSAPKILEVLQKITALKKGNYLALFPSFEFLDRVTSLLKENAFPEMSVLVQQRSMRAQLTEDYLATLKDPSRSTLLLGVQGGIFSEGVDYPGDMLIGVFVIGPALPHFDFEREEIKKYYAGTFGEENAFNFAYVYPAMARAVQSAGRVIRTETDRGIIVLLDSRFLEKSYAESMPGDWYINSPEELLSQRILSDIHDFWKEGEIK